MVRSAVPDRRKRFPRRLWENILRYPVLYLMVLPLLIYYVVFHYFPMYGIVIAFQRFVPARGLMGSKWIGLNNFRDFFTDPYFFRLVRNTFMISLYQLVFGFPVPVLFALLLNEVKSKAFVKGAQTVTYMPHFISAIVVCGILLDFTKSDGLITNLLGSLFGMERMNMLSRKDWFRTIYTSLNIWQEFGWESVIFFAALSGIDPALYEAARVDGAGRFRQAAHVSLPGLLPTIVILLILRMGRMLSVGWEKIILLYNPMTYETADVISTYVYRRGLLQFEYSYGAAVGLFNSLVNCMLLLLANAVSRRVNETSLW